jgi:excisionase family DNA binding protein
MAETSFLTIREMAKRLAIAPSTAYALVQSGKIASHRIGIGRGAIRIDEQDLKDFLGSCRSSPRPETRPRLARARLKHLKL